VLPLFFGALTSLTSCAALTPASKSVSGSRPAANEDPESVDHETQGGRDLDEPEAPRREPETSPEPMPPSLLPSPPEKSIIVYVADSCSTLARREVTLPDPTPQEAARAAAREAPLGGLPLRDPAVRVENHAARVELQADGRSLRTLGACE